MNAQAWAAAKWARTLSEAHEALVALRPMPNAARSVWVSYYQRSAEVYRQVAEVDRGHQGHAMYWADRERAKAELLNGQPDPSSVGSTAQQRKRRNNNDPAALPSSLQQAHDELSKSRPSAEAGHDTWLAYHQHAAATYAEVAEVDRAHHHEALAYAGLSRRYAAWYGRIGGDARRS